MFITWKCGINMGINYIIAFLDFWKMYEQNLYLTQKAVSDIKIAWSREKVRQVDWVQGCKGQWNLQQVRYLTWWYHDSRYTIINENREILRNIWYPQLFLRGLKKSKW